MQDWIYDDGGHSFPVETPSAIPANHPLRKLFATMVERAFLLKLGVFDSAVTTYVADVLTDFSHMKSVYKVRNLSGIALEEIADMLVEADVRLSATSFNREREVHKHIGDFALFWTGVFPDALPRLQASRRKDFLVDYVEQGKSSYAIAASFDHGVYEEQAPVLKRLSDEFELCMLGLNYVRSEIDQLPNKAQAA
ncbi:MAG: hypothetical protein P4L33_12385 [Capsulimonadaceae bacterium]|nr:hypothetical protein [Capsulimonadaceae bacterium]